MIPKPHPQSLRRLMGPISLIAFALGILPGCDSGSANRTTVQGFVKYQGQPIEDGTILFAPTADDQIQSNGVIQQGRYQIDGEYGPSLGEYIVRIEGFRSTGTQADVGPLHANEPAVDEVEPFIPAEFNSASTLRVTITKENRDSLDFDF